MEVHDITPVLGTEAPDWPGDPVFSCTKAEAMERGDSCDLSFIQMSAHTGAHLDAPAHFIPGGRTLDSYPASSFILPAMVARVKSDVEVRPEDLAHLEISRGMALLLKTKNSERGVTRNPSFSGDYIYLSREAAIWCVEKKLSLIGIDAPSIDRFKDAEHPAHQILLGAGILILEGICLNDVDPARHTLICLPLKLAGAEASPVRAVLTDYRQE